MDFRLQRVLFLETVNDRDLRFKRHIEFVQRVKQRAQLHTLPLGFACCDSGPRHGVRDWLIGCW